MPNYSTEATSPSFLTQLWDHAVCGPRVVWDLSRDQTVSRSAEKTTKVVWLNSLGLKETVLKKPVRCDVERIGTDNYMASFSDARLFASGDTEIEAIQNLKDIIATKFLVFSRHPKDKLGPSLKGQLAVLRLYIQD